MAMKRATNASMWKTAFCPCVSLRGRGRVARERWTSGVVAGVAWLGWFRVEARADVGHGAARRREEPGKGRGAT